MDYLSIGNIPDYPQKKEDLMDCHNYLLDNTDYYDNEEEFDLTDFDFEFKESSLDIIFQEASKLKDTYLDIESDKLRIEKIEKCLSLDFPVYIYNGEIIAGVHRAIAYLNKEIPTIPVVIIEHIG